jgi:trypsin-like peptidase
MLCSAVPWMTSSGNVKRLTPHPCIVTCYHVVKPTDVTPVDTLIHQPEPLGFGNVVAAFYVGEWDVALCNLADRAMDQGPPENDILGRIGPITGIAEPQQERIWKYGRTTGSTSGMYTQTVGCKGDVGAFCFQVVPQGGETFCKEGDSGAALVNDAKQLVGIPASGTKTEPKQPVLSLRRRYSHLTRPSKPLRRKGD